jgi:hypothetical protein
MRGSCSCGCWFTSNVCTRLPAHSIHLEPRVRWICALCAMRVGLSVVLYFEIYRFLPVVLKRILHIDRRSAEHACYICIYTCGQNLRFVRESCLCCCCRISNICRLLSVDLGRLLLVDRPLAAQACYICSIVHASPVLCARCILGRPSVDRATLLHSQPLVCRTVLVSCAL